MRVPNESRSGDRIDPEQLADMQLKVRGFLVTPMSALPPSRVIGHPLGNPSSSTSFGFTFPFSSNHSLRRSLMTPPAAL